MRPSETGASAVEGVVVCARSGFVEVDVDGAIRVCRMRGRLKQGKRTTDLAVIGDRAMSAGRKGR